MNYTKTVNPSVTKGKMSDVIKPRKRLFTRSTSQNSTEATNEMKLDLVTVLTDLGLVLSKTHSIASSLVQKGWIKTEKIKQGSS